MLKSRFNLIIISILILICACNKKETHFSAAKDLSSRISDASSFDDIFKLEKEIQLSNNGYSFANLSDIVIGKDNDIILTDRWMVCSLVVFDSSGNFKKVIGRKGDGPGEYNNIQSLTKNSKGEILLFDFFGFKVSIFDSNYNFVRQFNSKSILRGLYAYGKDKLFLYDTDLFMFAKAKNKNSIISINYDGDTLKSFAPVPTDLLNLKFSPFCKGIAFDKTGHIYEMNPMFYEIRKFDLDGNLIKIFGEGKFKLVEHEGSNGHKFQVPLFYEGPFVFDSKVVMVVTDKGLDFYDDEGNLITRSIKCEKSILDVIDNKLYVVDKSNEEKNPKILIYTFK